MTYTGSYNKLRSRHYSRRKKRSIKAIEDIELPNWVDKKKYHTYVRQFKEKIIVCCDYCGKVDIIPWKHFGNNGKECLIWRDVRHSRGY